MKDPKIKKLFKIISNVLFIGIILFLIFFILNYKMYIITSGSMEPEIKTHELVVVKTSLKEYKVGDIISYYDKSLEIPVTHRVIEYDKDQDIYITKGDANNTDDNVPLTKENIIGKVVCHSYPLGNFYMKYSTPIFIGCVIIIVAVIIKEILRMFKKKDPEENNKIIS